MTELLQRANFRTLYFSAKEDGVHIKESSFLQFKTKEQFVPFLDLGTETVKEKNNEGIPTLVIVGFFALLDVYVTITNINKKPSVALIAGVSLIAFAMVIIYTIQTYIKSVYRIAGGEKEIELLRYSKGEPATSHFIQYLIQQAKRAQVLQYNDLLQHISNNDGGKFPFYDPEIELNDKEFKQFQKRAELLYSKVWVEEEEEDEEELYEDED